MTRFNNITGRLPKRRHVISFAYHALFLIIVYVVQALVLPYITALPSIPLILPLAAVGAAMFEGGSRGAAAGLFAGALCDLSMNQPIASFTVLFTVMCLAIGILSDTVIARGFAPYFLMCVGALALCSFVQMFTLLFFDDVPPRGLLTEALRQGLVSLPFTVPVYFGARGLVRRKESVQ
ncbi:MAG: hypothetical protein LBN99_05385 [Oscillospiraceae bacterium]|jgi:hypothetical protein|nr:hypothetical protein [Oscillospiraceae bacterium]